MSRIMEAPVAGSGLHEWILGSSRQLLIEGYDPDEVVRIMIEKAEGKGRKVEGEIQDAVNGAVKWLAEHPDCRQGKGGRRRQEYEPQICHEWLGSGLLDRRDNRPEYSQADSRKIAAILATNKAKSVRGSKGFDWWKLYAGVDFYICLCQQVWAMETRRLSEWLELGVSGFQYMVTSPMFQGGMGSRFKCDKNTSKRMWLIIEFDAGSREDQLKLLAWLERFEGWQLGMIVWSGGKSLHGWFPVYNKGEYEIRTFFVEATKIGADRMMRIPSQYCRVPNGLNMKTRRQQEVLYWKEAVVQEQAEIVRKDLL
jgi:hypothetical protein